MADRQRPDGSSSPGTPTGAAPVLLYDGACGLCASSVQLVLRHDPDGPLRFASLQGPFGRAVVARHDALHGVDSMIWVEPSGPATAGAEAGTPLERVYVRSDAVLRVCGYLGGAWSLLGIGAIVPRALRDGLYALVARHRHALARPVCVLPTDAQRARFID